MDSSQIGGTPDVDSQLRSKNDNAVAIITTGSKGAKSEHEKTPRAHSPGGITVDNDSTGSPEPDHPQAGGLPPYLDHYKTRPWGKVTHGFAVLRHRVQVVASHPWLSTPLLGQFLTDWVIDINLLELIVTIAVVLLTMIAGEGHKWGVGAAYISAFAIGVTPRNAFFTRFLGLSFERMLKYHRWLGYFLLVPLLVHTIVYNGFTPCNDVTRDWFSEENMKKQMMAMAGMSKGMGHSHAATDSSTHKPAGGGMMHSLHRVDMLCWCNNKYNLSGVLPTFAYFVIFIMSLDFVRRRFFESFYFTHFMFLVYAGGSIWHSSRGYMIPHFAVPLGLWALDRIVRFMQDVPTAEVVAVEAYPGDMTKISVTKVGNILSKLRYRAGQYAFINIPSVSLVQWHPMSFSSAPGDPTITFHIRGVGVWSQALKDKVTQGVKVHMNGGYGDHAFSFKKVDTLVLVGGGSGIVPMMSLLRHLHQQPASSQLKWSLRRVHLIWTVKDISHVSWFASELAEVSRDHDSSTTRPVEFSVSIHVTGKQSNISDSSAENGECKRQIPEVLLKLTQSGRPVLTEVLDVEASRLTEGGTVGVAVCGPSGLVWEARRAAGKATGTKNGVRFVTNSETFVF